MNFRITGRRLTLSSLGLLALWMLLWLGLLISVNGRERISWLCLALLPIVIVSHYVYRNHKGGYAWSGFMALGYLAQGTTVVLTSKTDADYATVEVFLSLLLFTAASAGLRERRRDD
jgi:uncharacterized membrane protein